MRFWPILSLLLFLALLGSNIYWVYETLDFASIRKYQDQLLYECTESSASLRSVIPELAAGKSKSELVELVEDILQETSFEKDGVIVIGWVVLEFDENDQLEKVL